MMLPTIAPSPPNTTPPATALHVVEQTHEFSSAEARPTTTPPSASNSAPKPSPRPKLERVPWEIS
jgi:hypothetical protein